jgi:hypothetical protein
MIVCWCLWVVTMCGWLCVGVYEGWLCVGVYGWCVFGVCRWCLMIVCWCLWVTMWVFVVSDVWRGWQEVWRSYGHETGAAWFLASCGPAVFIIYLSVCFSTWSNCQPAFHHQHPTLHRTVSGLNGSRTQTLSEPAAMHTLFVWIPLSQYISSKRPKSIFCAEWIVNESSKTLSFY